MTRDKHIIKARSQSNTVEPLSLYSDRIARWNERIQPSRPTRSNICCNEMDWHLRNKLINRCTLQISSGGIINEQKHCFADREQSEIVFRSRIDRRKVTELLFSFLSPKKGFSHWVLKKVILSVVLWVSGVKLWLLLRVMLQLLKAINGGASGRGQNFQFHV